MFFDNGCLAMPYNAELHTLAVSQKNDYFFIPSKYSHMPYEQLIADEDKCPADEDKCPADPSEPAVYGVGVTILQVRRLY